MSIINVYSNHEAKEQTFFLNDIQGGVHNVVKFQCIISINETLQVKRIVLCPLPPPPIPLSIPPLCSLSNLLDQAPHIQKLKTQSPQDLRAP